MYYLHTMLRVSNLDESLDFFCDKLGMIELRRVDNTSGRFTLVFLTTPHDIASVKASGAPTLELTYNWPDANGKTESYDAGRNFGHLAYRVDHIYQTCQRLMDAGVIIHRPPRDGYMAFIKSPDGISIELLQNGEKLEPEEPWISMSNKGAW